MGKTATIKVKSIKNAEIPNGNTKSKAILTAVILEVIIMKICDCLKI